MSWFPHFRGILIDSPWIVYLLLLFRLSVSDNMVEEVVWSEVPSVPSLTFLGIYGNKVSAVFVCECSCVCSTLLCMWVVVSLL